MPTPRRTRSTAPRRAALPAVPLPCVRVAQDVPAATAVALLTEASHAGASHAGASGAGASDAGASGAGASEAGGPGAGVSVLGTTAADVTAALSRERATGKPGEVVVVPLPDDAGRVLLLAGSGDRSATAMRRAGAALARAARSHRQLAVDLRAADLSADAVRALVEGALLGSYAFSRKRKPEPRVLQELAVAVPDPAAVRDAVRRAEVVAAATAAARDLVNTPSLDKTPQWLADRARDLLDGVEVRVLDEPQLRDRGFGGILAVGQGSTRPPRLVEARYDGGPAGARAPHVVLVGKGITFDSGGLSLKPNDSMVAMKTDMGGAAAVLGALAAVVRLQLPVRVTALVAAAENMPSGTAQRPGDVLRQYGGRTVEVLNTDAEGRLVLADALAYAVADLDADLLVDVATLTGAMPVALGRQIGGLFCSDDALADELLAASAAAGEPAWRMPLVDDYRHALDSPVADLRNIGQPRLKLQGGSITAALFLREFTDGRPWAHLDIAGPARSVADEHEVGKGGTGYGVRLLTRWLERRSEQSELVGAPPPGAARNRRT